MILHKNNQINQKIKIKKLLNKNKRPKILIKISNKNIQIK